MIRRPPRSTLFPLHDALPIWDGHEVFDLGRQRRAEIVLPLPAGVGGEDEEVDGGEDTERDEDRADRKSTRLNSSHSQISYAVFCLKKKKQTDTTAETVPCEPL